MPPRRLVALFVVLAATFILLASCATLFSGSNDRVRINSNPRGADVYIDGVPYGKTPLSVKLQKNNYYHVAISHEGYETAYVSITSREGIGWILLDALFLGAPMVIDAITGAWANLTPDWVNVTLEPLPAMNVTLEPLTEEDEAASSPLAEDEAADGSAEAL